ncbi:alpha-E domain-containing protein [Microlunatus ginsengisoli]|uniref:Alpha-E domain-containing protein n=1 Tax=Microlunatus ginsengisoli TaxID=363863 RepID=A0ABP7A1H1_9ACTN
MLSRIAEALFWIGRYVERADDTARLLQTHLRVMLETNPASESESCANLLALMGIDDIEHPGKDDLLRVLGYDARESSSIFACWAAARDNARRAREVIPAELWQCINTTWHNLPSGRLQLSQAHGFCDWARERSALFSGLARTTMVRDDGWQYLLLGRSLEQADMTSRMVASAAPATGTTQWPQVLRGAGGHDAFLRTYRGVHSDAGAAEFLIVDARFPRSVMHGLVAASDCLDKVSTTKPAHAATEQAQRRLGRLRAHLEYASIDEVVADLEAEMTRVQDVCAEVSDIAASAFFAAADPRAWIREGTR